MGSDTVSAGIWSWEGFAWTISEKAGHHTEIIPDGDHPGQTCLVLIPFHLKQDYQILLKLPRPKGLFIHFSTEKSVLIKTEINANKKKSIPEQKEPLKVPLVPDSQIASKEIKAHSRD